MSEEPSPFQGVWDAIHRSVDLTGPLTEAQARAVAHALTAVIAGAPDAFFGIKRDGGCPVGGVLYKFYWVKGGVFGLAEVLRPDDQDLAAPATASCIRPLSGIRKVDVQFDVTNPPVGQAQYTVKMKVTAHWDDESVVLDATGGMSNYARPELEKLIDLVVSSVGGSN
ncbi:hypothetical protein [Mycolicibacter longobardus]|uniref:Uncharacterized protein n=1 Tax=Mycolicibacter longobardus TaxID=1108812 RepID=A0A1X1YEW8_9MYCO|nr:hypothetical protein [Mycolicibacter longobardus]MCV7385953.1 hypothetical protein [Mycolicibacter longobardus]ORW09672.1 hypothetical protein AWC16_15810 [Mycolicibacter longobardus]